MKKNLLLLFLLIIIAVFIFYRIKKNLNNKKNEQTINKLFTINENQAFKWEINFKSNHIICENKNQNWSVIYPKKYEGDNNSIFANVKNFNSIEYINIIKKNPDQASQYGIDISKFNFAIYLTNNNKLFSHKITVGNKTFEDGYYIYYDKTGYIYAVESWAIEMLDKKTSNLRAKNFIIFEPEEITELDYADNLIKKTRSFWTYNKLDTNEMDLSLILEIVQAFGFLKAESVFDEKEIITETGLNNPDFIVKITGYKKNVPGYDSLPKVAQQTIHINKINSIVYAKKSNGKEIYIIKENIYNLLLKKPGEFKIQNKSRAD